MGSSSKALCYTFWSLEDFLPVPTLVFLPRVDIWRTWCILLCLHITVSIHPPPVRFSYLLKIVSVFSSQWGNEMTHQALASLPVCTTMAMSRLSLHSGHLGMPQSKDRAVGMQENRYPWWGTWVTQDALSPPHLSGRIVGLCPKWF